MQTYLTLQEAAARLRVHPKTLSGVLKRHPHFARIGHKIIISEEDLAKLYEALKEPKPERVEGPVWHAGPSQHQIYKRLRELTDPPAVKRKQKKMGPAKNE